MTDEANIFTSSWDFSFDGASGAPVGRRAGTELLGATVYELEPGAKWPNLHIHHANEELIVVLGGTPTVRLLEATGSWRAARSSRARAGVPERTASRTARASPPEC